MTEKAEVEALFYFFRKKRQGAEDGCEIGLAVFKDSKEPGGCMGIALAPEENHVVFIPCQKGISHNRAEFASLSSICDGARVIYEYLKGAAE